MAAVPISEVFLNSEPKLFSTLPTLTPNLPFKTIPSFHFLWERGPFSCASLETCAHCHQSTYQMRWKLLSLTSLQAPQAFGPWYPSQCLAHKRYSVYHSSLEDFIYNYSMFFYTHFGRLSMQVKCHNTLESQKHYKRIYIKNETDLSEKVW